MSAAGLITDAIRSAGIPCLGVAVAQDGTVRLLGVPESQQALAQAIAAGVDTTEVGMLRALAKAILLADDPRSKASRAEVRALRNILVTFGAKINELIAFSNTKGASIATVSAPAWAQALTAIRQQIDTETDPST